MPGQYPIERGVPVPENTKSAAGRPTRYPFADLQVGDSFFVKSSKKHFTSERSLCSALHRARTLLGWNFIWSRADDGFRIHRLEGKAIPREYIRRSSKRAARKTTSKKKPHKAAA